MGRSVEDIAALLTAMAGSDPADAASVDADAHRTDYVAALAGATLKGKRLGVLSFAAGGGGPTEAAFQRTVELMKAQGAEIVELPAYKPAPELGDDEVTVLLTELKADLNAYLATTPPTVTTRTLADVIAFNRNHPRELALFGQELFEQAEATKGLDDADYKKARENARRLAGAEGIDALLEDNHLDALIAPSYGPAWRIDVATGDHGSGRASGLPAIAGYPHLTVPMAFDRGLPLGVSFIGPAWSEARLLQLGYAFEQAAHVRRPPGYIPSLEATPEVEGVVAPNP
jgi:amidase